MANRNWTRAETLVAFALYCRLPFGRLHARNPEIVTVAKRLGRTPSSVAMKCCNLASLDETHQARGVQGLKKASAIDRAVWAEFQADPDKTSFDALTALAECGSRQMLPESSIDFEYVEGIDREVIRRTRVNQYFFRDLILAGYGEKCAVCGLPIANLLVAAHIVPWAVDASQRMNPRNGLCLCGTHDLAFERGYLKITRDFVIEIAVPREYHSVPVVTDFLRRYHGAPMQIPQRWCPDPNLLERKLALITAGAAG